MSVILVLVEGFISLYNQIKQNIYTKPGIFRLQKWIQKLVNTGQSTFVECILLENRNQLLTKLNN